MPDQPGIDVDWDNWTAKMRSMLVFVRREDEVLLIRKKRGLGEGKINGPGGKVDEGKPLRRPPFVRRKKKSDLPRRISSIVGNSISNSSTA